MSTVVEFAPAKVNLNLHVLGRRADGYHALSSVVAFVDVGDELTLAPAAQNQIEAEGPFAALLPENRDNSIWKAYHWLAGRMALPSVHVRLKKNLPLASGIGGGSSNAAAMLRGLLQMVGNTLDASSISSLAHDLGADVPVCFHGKPCLMEGIGERVTPLSEQLPAALVLANPLVPCSTPEVFKAMGLAVGEMRAAPATAQWRNDMTAAAVQVQPRIVDVLSALHKTEAFPVLMSGSGATCFGITRDFAQAEAIAGEMASAHKNWWIKPARILP